MEKLKSDLLERSWLDFFTEKIKDQDIVKEANEKKRARYLVTSLLILVLAGLVMPITALFVSQEEFKVFLFSFAPTTISCIVCLFVLKLRGSIKSCFYVLFIIVKY